MPYFATTYEYGFGNEPCTKDGCLITDNYADTLNPYCSSSGAVTTCTDCNSSTGYETFLDTCHSLAYNTTSPATADDWAWQNNTHCYSCADWGFKTTSQGLGLLILVIGIISFAIIFVTTIRKFR